MGGFGSGRQGGKDTTGGYRTLDVRWLQRKGMLKPGLSYDLSWSRRGEPWGKIQARTGADRVTLIYRHQKHGGEWQDREYPVSLDWTPCNYGGRRAWFRCPAAGCGRRVALLYLGNAGIFACRHCYQLAYECERENTDDRATRQADKIREHLGWDAGILNLKGGKPKGMHWRTFERLDARHDAFVGVSLAGMAKRLGLLERQLDGIRADMDGWG
jgi:hypothetical protein